MLRLKRSPWRRFLCFDGSDQIHELPASAPAIDRGDWVVWQLLPVRPGGATVFKGRVRGAEHDLLGHRTHYFIELDNFENTETL